MKRRDFLKLPAAALAVAAVPVLADTNITKVVVKGKAYYYEGQAKKIAFSEINKPTTWNPVPDDAIKLAKTIKIKLEDDVFTKEQVRQLIDGINEELDRDAFKVGDIADGAKMLK